MRTTILIIAAVTGMASVRAPLRRLLLLVVLIFGLTPVAWAEPRPGTNVPIATVPTENLQQAVLDALAAGKVDSAEIRARVLLARDPRDGYAHLALASVFRAKAQPGAASRHAGRSFRLSRSAEQRLQAAYIASQSAYEARRDLAALYWLRRAMDQTGDPIRRRAIADDYGRLLAIVDQNLSVSGAITPSSNVNAGSLSQWNRIEGVSAIGLLSPDAQALPGISVEAAIYYARTIQRDVRGQTRLGLAVSGRHVFLDRTALDRLGSTPRPNLDTGRIELNLSHTRQFGGSETARSEISGGIGLGSALREGAAPLGYGRVWLSHDRALGSGLDLSMSVRAETVAPSGQGLAGDQRFGAQLGLRWDQVAGGAFSVIVDMDRQITVPTIWAGSTVAGRMRFQPDGLIGGFALRLDVGMQSQVFPDYTVATILVPGGRRDLSRFVEIGLSPQMLGLAGFSPEIRLRHGATGSNVSRFDSMETSLSLGLSSSF